MNLLIWILLIIAIVWLILVFAAHLPYWLLLLILILVLIAAIGRV